MAELLNSDQIAKLFDDAAAGIVHEPGDSDRDRKTGPARTRGLRTIDFRHPTKFTGDQERRIQRTLDQFCRTATRRLGAELRGDAALEVIDVMQLTWFNAHAQIPHDSICALVDQTAVNGDGVQEGSTIVMTAEAPLMVNFVERLLGGGDAAIRDRKLSDIDLVLSRRFFTAMVEELSVSWAELTGQELSMRRLEGQPETGNLATASEPTLVFVMEGRMNKTSSTVLLLLPYAAAGTVPGAFERNEEEEDVDPAVTAAVHANMSRVRVPVRAEVAATEMLVEDVLALREGDVVGFGTQVEEGITLYADSVAVHRAKPGRVGRMRAAQVTHPLEGRREH